MALQNFRDRQKLIYWIISPIVIISFVLWGFTGAFQSGDDLEVGRYFGKRCSRSEFYAFQQRLSALYNYQQTYLGEIDRNGMFRPFFGQNNPAPSIFLMMALAEDARRHGIEVTDDEVGTFVRHQIHYTGTSAKEFRERLEREIANRNLRFSNVFEYQQAVRENLLARKFLALIDNSLVVPAPFVELSCTQERAAYSFKRAFVSSASKAAEAAAEIAKLPEPELLAKAADFIKTNQIPANRDRYGYLWEEPRWRLEYIYVPFEVPSREPKITEEKVKEHYESNKNSYKDDKGAVMELAQVREKVEADLRQSERVRNAQNTIKSEVDSFIRRREKNISEQNSMDPVTIQELNNDPRLASLALKAGDTGTDKRTIAEIFAEAPLKEFAMSANFVFNGLDRQACQKMDEAVAKGNGKKQADKGANDVKTKALEDFMSVYRKSFHGQSYGPGMPETPLRGENGLLKFRVVEYVPGLPRSLKGADGKTDEKLLASIKATLTEDLTMEKTRQAAEAVQTAMKEKKQPEGVEVKDETATVFSMSPAQAQMLSAAVDDVSAPSPVRYPESGFEVLQLAGVKFPAEAELASDIARAQAGINLAFRSGLPYAPEAIVSPWILVGMRGKSYLQTRLGAKDGIIIGAALRNAREDAE